MFRVLLVGWVVGGALIVVLGAPAFLRPGRRLSAAAPTTATHRLEAGGPAGWNPALPMREILIPVQGVSVSDLRDSFSDARSGGRTHEAIDILAPYGTPVMAAVDGTIHKLFQSGAGGITIYQFDRAEERVYYYAHLERYANGLAEGLFVPRGTVIAYVGTTGNAHGTPHLHFAIELLPPTKEWWKGTPIDPYPLLTR